MMMVGKTWSGKSKIIEILQKTLTSLKDNINYFQIITYKINPKAIDGYMLYGKLDSETKIWTDGILS